MIGEGAAMRLHLPIFLAMLAIAAPAAAETRNFGINSFEKIRVDGPFRVTLTTGVAPYAKAIGSAQAIDKVAVDVQGSTLVVHNNVSSWGADSGANSGPVEIQVGTHDLSSAWLNGSGSLAINKVKGLRFDLSIQGSALGEVGSVAVDQLTISVSGSGSLRLAGDAGKVTSTLRGNSTLDAAKLKVKDAVITADGPGTVDATITNSVKVSAFGPATIRIGGNPGCTLQTSGSASVSGCKSTQ